MFEVAKFGVHLLPSKMTVISSVGETPSPLGHFLLLGGSQLLSVLGKSLLMALVSFYLFLLLLPFLANVPSYLGFLFLVLALFITCFPLPPCWGSEEGSAPTPWPSDLLTWRNVSQEPWRTQRTLV